MCSFSMLHRLFGDLFLSAAINKNGSDETWWITNTENEIKKSPPY